MTPEELAWLRTPPGMGAAELATTLLAAASDELRIIEQLRKVHEPGNARAALALALGRRTAAMKFPDGERLYCDRAAAEQASSEIVAAHSAERFEGASLIADLGCGMGGDALALARHAPVVAVDSDAGRAAMAAANAGVRGLGERVEVRTGELEGFAPADRATMAWLDPGRRDGNGRLLDPERWSPSLSVAIGVARRFAGAGIKLAPGIERELLPQGGELEFVSLDGRMVEGLLWLGSLAGDSRRATVLTPEGGITSMAGEPDGAESRVEELGGYLLDPDPAVGRAELIGSLARATGAWQIDSRMAYLSSDEPVSTPFARRFRVVEALPFSERRLLGRLRALDASRVEVMRRGSPVETNALETRLGAQLDGSVVFTMALTRVGGQHVAIVCQRERDGG
jgi:SAM-dependent methyltransferase